MRIHFADAKLKKICTDDRAAIKRLGPSGASKLQSRLADLDAATTLGAVVFGRPHPLAGDRMGQFALDLDRGRRLILASADPGAVLADGVTDWPSVTAVNVIEIGDYHD